MKHKPQKFSTWFLTHPVIASINLVMGVVLVVIGCFVFALNNTKQMVRQLQTGDINQAITSAQRAKPIVVFFNGITLFRVPDLKVWHAALNIPENISDIIATSESIGAQYQDTKQADLTTISQPIQQLSENISKIEERIDETWFLKDELPTDAVQLLHRAPEVLSSLENLLEYTSEGSQTWVILLQNTDELRATGGFPGSYALVNLQDGVITDIVIEDIYDADGQFKGYISAPAGISQYTSGNKGLRLPDANWWPDFPTSAQTMLQFFALGDKQKITGLVAINSSLVSQLLEITGPIELPDYNISLNSENMRQVLRSERGSFFPGSNQKKFVLNQAFTQFQRQVASMPNDKKVALALQLKQAITSKDIQMYSPQPDIEQIFAEFQLAGILQQNQIQLENCDCQPVSLLLLESNVGINKVNPFISRSVEVTVNDSSLTIQTQFHNAAAPMSQTELSGLLASSSATPAPRNGNGYLNYYRVLIDPNYQVQNIVVGSQPITNWDDELLTTSNDQQLRQIGFVMGIPEKQTVTAKIELQTKQPVPSSFYIFKQSGLQATPYTFIHGSNQKQMSINQDTLVQLTEL